MRTVIKIENVGKQYRLGQIGTGSLAHDVNRWWYKVRGKEDPYLKLSEANDRASKGESDYVWALKDISFDVKQGEVLGIIGRNGAGKSTLLKILSRTTAPTTGSIKVRGRIASLLEVGTGFHPELTGRNNIYLNGAILGMTKNEIKRKFDEIVDFSGVERYIDTPVKRYSSGMYVRLAFAVAAHLEPEILIVDEVLAVGDADFQKKCLGKMKDVSKSEGRTVLFVSHNMGAIKSICSSGLLLENGTVKKGGGIDKVLNSYLEGGLTKSTNNNWENNGPGNENIKLRSFQVFPKNGKNLDIESGIGIKLIFLNFKKNIDLAVSVFFYTIDNVFLFEAGIVVTEDRNSREGVYTIEIEVPPYLLNAGFYNLNLVFGENQKYLLFSYEDQISIELGETFFDRGKNLEKVQGILRPKFLSNIKFENGL
jgi:lipopolysaccharide transport system ATP-binding protein